MQNAPGNPIPYRIAIALTILAGIALRVGHLFFIDLETPFRLGGLFLEFSNRIIEADFRLPSVIPNYSAGGLPFAYPPLSFYIQALIIALFHPAKFVTVNLIPPVVAALGVPSFYVLVRQLNLGRLETWCMLAAFAFIPNTFLDPIEAAGLPEAFGILALIWYAACLIRVYQQPGRNRALAAGLLLGVCLLSSPGSVVAAPLLSVIYLLMAALRALRERQFGPLAWPLLIALIGLAVSAPWWLSVLLHHGRGVFLNSLLNQFETGQRLSFLQQSLDRLLTFNFSSIRNNSFLWSALTFLGMISFLNWPGVILVLLFMGFSLLPREGIWLSAMTASFLAGRGLMLLIESVRDMLADSPHRRWLQPLGMVAFLVIALYTAYYATAALVRDRQWALEAREVASLEAGAPSIPPKAQVIVIGSDAFMEWAPQLLQREVVNIPYGLEWQPHELNTVNRFNKDLESAVTFDDIMAAVKARLRIRDAYLVTNSLDRFAKMEEGSPPHGGSVESLNGAEDLRIYHLLINE